MKLYQKIISGLIIAFFVAIAVFIGVFLFNNKDVFVSRSQSEYREENVSIVTDPVTFLVMGADNTTDQSRSEAEGYRTDVLIYGAVDVQSHRLTMVSIPRDTLAYIPCIDDYGKINSAMQYGYTENQSVEEGIQCTVETVENLFQKPVDYHVFITFDTFITFINEIGGITLTATQTFCEQDSQSNPDAYCFEEGETYLMDGEMALAYARNRHADSDYERGLRQQEVIQAAIQQLLKPENLLNLPSIIQNTLDSGVVTNLSINEMYSVGMYVANEIANGVKIGMNITNLRLYGYDVSYGGSTNMAVYQESLDFCIQAIDDVLNQTYTTFQTTSSFTFTNPEENFIPDGAFYEGTPPDYLNGIVLSEPTAEAEVVDEVIISEDTDTVEVPEEPVEETPPSVEEPQPPVDGIEEPEVPPTTEPPTQ